MVQHPFGETAKRRGPPYLHPYACTRCRSSFRRGGGPDDHVLPCVRCRAPSVRLSRKFKPPKRDDHDQWRKVEALIRAGFHFESVPERYPERLSEVAGFAERLSSYLADKRRRWPALMAATEEALK